MNLKERMNEYIDNTNYRLLSKLPTVFIVNGRSFNKVTSLLEKPFSSQFSELMLGTMLRLCSEIEGSFFGYHFNDEIIIFSKNDNKDSPWYDNRIQKLCSAVSSIASIYFHDMALSNEVNLIGTPIFLTQVCTLPNITEAMNFCVQKQHQASQESIHQICTFELLQKYNKSQIKEMLNGLSSNDKIEILKQETGKEIVNYPLLYRRGCAAYRKPVVVNDEVKNKWSINTNLPLFTQDHSFLSNIFIQGTDIFRAETI